MNAEGSQNPRFCLATEPRLRPEPAPAAYARCWRGRRGRPVGTRSDTSGARNHVVNGFVVEMVVEQGLPEPSLSWKDYFWLAEAKSLVAAAGFEPATKGL